MQLGLSPDLVAELIEAGQAREALRSKLETVAGIGSSAAIETFKDDGVTVSYVRITVRCRDGRTAEAILYTRAYGAHSGRPIQTDGKMQFQSRDRQLVAALSEVLKPFAESVGKVAGREKMRKKVRSIAQVLGESRTADGTIVQRVRL